MASQSPRINYPEIGIPIGDVIVFREFCSTDGSPITAKVVSNCQVLYCGEKYYLTNLTQELLPGYTTTRPEPHWSYKGVSLAVIYRDKHFPQLGQAQAKKAQANKTQAKKKQTHNQTKKASSKKGGAKP